MSNLKSICAWVVLSGSALIFSGCGTVREAYIPDHLGNMSDFRNDQGIKITLIPDKYRAQIGDKLIFKTVIQNVGQDPVVIPSDPDLLLTWVYPDGRRDNLVRDEEGARPHDQLVLEPGQKHVVESVVATYYFDRIGIHEFRAVLYGRNALARNETAWTGRAISNGFGIYFDRF